MEEIKSISVFVIEDEILTQEDLIESITQLGHEIVGTARTRDEALVKLETLSPDLVLLDIMLDKEKDRYGGIKVARKIREYSTVPIIFITALKDEEIDKMIKEVGAIGFLEKPFRERELRFIIDKLISQIESSNDNGNVPDNTISLGTQKILNQSIYVLSHDNEYIQIPISEIRWIEAMGSSIGIHTDKERLHIVSCNLSHFHRQNNHPALLRVHKSYTINVNYIKSFRNPNLLEVPGKSIPIGKNMLITLKKSLPIIKSV